MAGLKTRAFERLMHWRYRAQRAGMDRLAQRHPRLRSVFRSIYRPLYRLVESPEMLTVEFDGFSLSASSKQRDLALLLFGGCERERRQARWMASLLGEGMAFVDVGAHIGIYTLPAARRVGPRGKVYAFEPAPENFRALRHNILQNGLSNVVAEPLAVSRNRSRAMLSLSAADSASHSLAASLHQGRRIAVDTISLDEYFSGIHAKVDVVKLDAEGAELAILEGMQQILRENPNLTLFTELYPRAMEAFGSSPEEFLARLDDLGFALAPFEEDRPAQEPVARKAFAGLLSGLRAKNGGINLLCRRGLPAALGMGQSPGAAPVRKLLISIAIPVYNRAALLERTLESIQSQLAADVEIVVYDTGSTDGTRDRMERLAARAPGIRFFHAPDRRSLDETLLLLLEAARGEYVWFFSSDDLMKPGAVATVRRRILSSRERPALVYANQEIRDEAGRLLIRSQVGSTRDRDFPDGRKIVPWLGLNLGFISASLIRRETALGISSVREFIGTRSLNLHLYLRCLMAGGPALYIGEPLVRARRAAGAPPYEYRDVFVRDVVRIFRDARRRGFGRLAIHRAMNRVVAGHYLRLVLSWRADDPAELARTFPAMARSCWFYPAFWLLLPVRFAPARLVRQVRNTLRKWRERRNEIAPEVSPFRAAFRGLLAFRKSIARFRADRIVKAIPLAVPSYRGLYAFLRPMKTIRTEYRGHTVCLDAADLVITRSVLSSGAWEEFETDIFGRVVGKGMVVVDVGANVGHYALEAARCVGERGKVYAFEPEPHNFDLLCRNIEINGYLNITPVRKALSNRSGAARLSLSPDNFGGHHIEMAPASRDSIEVETIALDEYFRGRPQRIDVVKMDAEGAEVSILEGMRGLIEANPDLILFTEFSPHALRAAGADPMKFLETLAAAGFALNVLDEERHRTAPLPSGLEREITESLLRGVRGKVHINLLCLRGRPAREKRFLVEPAGEQAGRGSAQAARA